MSIQKMRCIIAAPFDGKTLLAVDEVGAEFRFAPEPESAPRAVVWEKGDSVKFQKLQLGGGFVWEGKRGTRGKDSGIFRMITE